MEAILWNDLELVIFDVDGTFYGQSKLRKIMLSKLFLYYLIRPWKCRELLILYHFRMEREKRAGHRGNNLEEEQYEWCATKMNIDIDEIKNVVNHWIFEAPNKYLRHCMYPGVIYFLTALKDKGIKTAVYSDYNSKIKLEQMGIKVDWVVSSTEQKVNSFKPNPDGLEIIISQMQIKTKANCLYIGDRFELDGLCAKNMDIPFLIVKEREALKDFYHKLAANILMPEKNIKND